MWETLSNFGSGAMEFARANPTLTGAALGAGAASLGGGDALKGGLLGGAAGYGAGQGLLGKGMQDYFGGADQSYSLGGLFGQPKTYTAQNAAGDLVQKNLAGSQVAQNTLGQQAGLFDRASNFYNTNKDMIGGGIDAFRAYGDYQSGREASSRADAELGLLRQDYNRRAAISDREQANMAATNQGAIDAHKKSRLNNYYSA